MLTIKSETEHRHVVALGSSSTEAFDYLFGRNDHYHPYWAAGWTARGLRNPETAPYLKAILSDLPRDSIVFLNFGSVDVQFSLRHKVHQEGFYKFEKFFHESIEGILLAVELIKALGFNDVYPAFISPIIENHQAFWTKVSNNGRQIPTRLMAKMYRDIAFGVSRETRIFETFEEMAAGEAGHFIAEKAFQRARDDHHPDYVQMLPILARKVAEFGVTLPPRSPAHTGHYGHKRVLIDKLMPDGLVRENTCR